MNKGLYYQGPAPSTFFSGSFLRQRAIFEFTVGWSSASGTLIALKRSRRMSMLVLHAPPICAKISAKAVWRVRMSRPRNDPAQSRVLAQSPLFRNRGKRVLHYGLLAGLTDVEDENRVAAWIGRVCPRLDRRAARAHVVDSLLLIREILGLLGGVAPTLFGEVRLNVQGEGERREAVRAAVEEKREVIGDEVLGALGWVECARDDEI